MNNTPESKHKTFHPNTRKWASTSTASQSVGKTDTSRHQESVMLPYRNRGSRRSARRSVKVQFRLDAGVYGVLRGGVPNVSLFLRGLVYRAVEVLPTYFECEEARLEVDVAALCEELNRVKGYSGALLKHGSYAKAYLEKLKGGVVVDRKPFYVSAPAPEVNKGELETVESVVEYRELLAVRLNEKLKRLIELKKAGLNSLEHTSEKRVGGES